MVDKSAGDAFHFQSLRQEAAEFLAAEAVEVDAAVMLAFLLAEELRQS